MSAALPFYRQATPSAFSLSPSNEIRCPTYIIIVVLVCFFLTDNHFVDDYARFSTLDTKEKSTAVANSMNYMTKKGQEVFPVVVCVASPDAV